MVTQNISVSQISRLIKQELQLKPKQKHLKESEKGKQQTRRKS